MPEWLIPALVAGGGGTGIGAIITALVNAKSSGFQQLSAVVSTMQAERAADDIKLAAQDRRIDFLYAQLGGWRDYGTAWEEWHAAGYPDPPGRPKRPAPPTETT